MRVAIVHFEYQKYLKYTVFAVIGSQNLNAKFTALNQTRGIKYGISRPGNDKWLSEGGRNR